MPPVERHLQVRRTARYFVLGELGQRTRELWIACHGYGQLAGPFAAALEPVVSESRAVIAPEALSRFYLDEPTKKHGPDSPVGAAWMTATDRSSDISDYVAYLDSVAETVRREAHPDSRVVALGFSQGVATVCRWAALGKTRIDRMVLWAGSLAADLPTDRGDRVFNGASVVMVAGRQDALVPVKFMQKERRSLEDRGLSVEFVEHDGAHALNSETLRRLAAAAQ